jgi:hypothetical protein
MDQARGGGGCGPEDQSGGRNGSAGLRTIATFKRRAIGAATAENTLKHLVRHCSGGQAALVSQHGHLSSLPD